MKSPVECVCFLQTKSRSFARCGWSPGSISLTSCTFYCRTGENGWYHFWRLFWRRWPVGFPGKDFHIPTPPPPPPLQQNSRNHDMVAWSGTHKRIRNGYLIMEVSHAVCTSGAPTYFETWNLNHVNKTVLVTSGHTKWIKMDCSM